MCAFTDSFNLLFYSSLTSGKLRVAPPPRGCALNPQLPVCLNQHQQVAVFFQSHGNEQGGVNDHRLTALPVPGFSANTGSHDRMQQFLENCQRPRVGEDDCRQGATVDPGVGGENPVAEMFDNPPAAAILVKERVADVISIDDVRAQPGHECGHLALAGAWQPGNADNLV